MFLRAYRPEDKSYLQQLFFSTVHTVNAGDYTPEQLAIWAPNVPDRRFWSLLDGQVCFVVENQKLPVGFIGLAGDGDINLLYVHADFQGRGIANALYKQVERLVRKRGLGLLQVTSSITARAFFEKKGFDLLGEVQEMRQGVEFLHYKMAKALLSDHRSKQMAHTGEVQTSK